MDYFGEFLKKNQWSLKYHFHLFSQEVVDSIASLPNQSDLVIQNGQITNEAGRHGWVVVIWCARVNLLCMCVTAKENDKIDFEYILYNWDKHANMIWKKQKIIVWTSLMSNLMPLTSIRSLKIEASFVIGIVLCASQDFTKQWSLLSAVNWYLHVHTVTIIDFFFDFSKNVGNWYIVISKWENVS